MEAPEPVTRAPRLLSLALLLACAVKAHGQAAPPPTPYEDFGACPFEGCVYREWRSRSPVEVHLERRDDSPVAFRVAKGEAVQALAGVVVTLRAGRVQFDRPQRLNASPAPIEVLPGQTLFLLTYQGEGFTKAWFNGRLYTDVDVASFMNGVCERVPGRCSGRMVEQSRTEWWVQIRNGSGQIGWTREPEKFDGSDALALLYGEGG